MGRQDRSKVQAKFFALRRWALAATLAAAGIAGPADAARAGNIAGNGGGLAEQNLLFAWQILPDVTAQCLRSELCASSPEARAALTATHDRLRETGQGIDFRFGEFPRQAEAVVLQGSELRIDSPRIYPDGKPWKLEAAFRQLFRAWVGPTPSSAAALATLDRIVGLFVQEPAQWGLSQFNYPDIRVLAFLGRYYFQGYEETHDLSAELARALAGDLGCGRARLDLEVSGVRIQGVRGQPGAKELGFYLESELSWSCAGRDGTGTLHWKLPLRIENGNFSELEGLKRNDLRMRLRLDELRFVVL